MPSVSFVIPAFNAKETIDETLESVVAQTRPDWEAIVVNDGSTDETLAIAESWQERDSRIRVMSRKNQGPAASRNAAAETAMSPWLLFLDADDLIAPNFMEAMLGMADWEPRAQAIYCGYIKFMPDGRRDNPQHPPPNRHFESLCRQNLFQPNGLLVRQEIFADAGRFDPSFRGPPEDWDLWLRIARTGAQFAGIPEPMALYRLRQGQLTSGAEALYRASCRVIDFAHGPDPRVKSPHPAFANGAPLHQRGAVTLRAAAWSAGVIVGAGNDPEPFLRSLQIEDVGNIEVEHIANSIAGAVPHGACMVYDDWPQLWRLHKPHVRLTVEHLARFTQRSDFADACWKMLRKNFSSIPGWSDS
jgi:hypothetical protein